MNDDVLVKNGRQYRIIKREEGNGYSLKEVIPRGKRHGATA